MTVMRMQNVTILYHPMFAHVVLAMKEMELTVKVLTVGNTCVHVIEAVYMYIH